MSLGPVKASPLLLRKMRSLNLIIQNLMIQMSNLLLQKPIRNTECWLVANLAAQGQRLPWWSLSVCFFSNHFPPSYSHIVTIKFMTKVNGVTRLFSLKSTALLNDLWDEVTNFHKKHHNQLKLFYTTIWSKQSDKLELSSMEDWDNLIAFTIHCANQKKSHQGNSPCLQRSTETK